MALLSIRYRDSIHYKFTFLSAAFGSPFFREGQLWPKVVFGGTRLSVPGSVRNLHRFATAPDVFTAGFRKHSGYLKPAAVFVPVGELSMCLVRVPSGRPVRVPGRENCECTRKLSIRGFQYKQLLNGVITPIRTFNISG